MLTTIVTPLLWLAIGFGVAWWLRGHQQRDLFINEARTDILTGLKNRRAFDEELTRQFAQRRRQGVYFSLIMIDIDGFKILNDVHGHPSGDLVLQTVAKVLSATLREMDLVYRYGGDEFAVLCPGSKLHEAAVAANRVRNAVAAQSLPLTQGQARVTVSLGVAEVADTELAESLIRRADDALFSAKRGGRDRVHWHNGDACVSAGNP